MPPRRPSPSSRARIPLLSVVVGLRGQERRSAATASPFLLAEHIQLDRHPWSGPRSRWLGTRSPISVKTGAPWPILQSFISRPVTRTHTSLPPPLLICCFKDLPEDIRWLIDVPHPCGDTAELLTGVFRDTPLLQLYLLDRMWKTISTACLIPHTCLSKCAVAPVWKNKGTMIGNKRRHFQSYFSLRIKCIKC